MLHQARSPARSPGRARLPRVELVETRPPTDARPLPTVAFASDPALRKRLQEDEARIDAARVALAAERAARRRAHEATVADLLDQGRRLERERVRLEQLQKEALRDQQVERADSDAASAIVQTLGTRQRTMQGQLEGLRADIEDWAARAAAKRSRMRVAASRLAERADNAEQAEAYTAVVSRTGPELSLLETWLGLRLRRKSRDLVTLTFTAIDASTPARAFSLDLDVAREAYAVPSCSPPLAALPDLLAELNAERDLGRFVRAVRAAFVAAALSTGPPL